MTWQDESGERRWGDEEEAWQRTRDWTAEEARQKAQYLENLRATLIPRACRSCGKAFKPLASPITRCVDCIRRIHEAMGTKPASIETKPCAICGQDFTAPVHWQRCVNCRLAGRTLYDARAAGRATTDFRLADVGVSIVSGGVLKCQHCATTWQPLDPATEMLPADYWKCPNGCNARKGGTP